MGDDRPFPLTTLPEVPMRVSCMARIRRASAFAFLATSIASMTSACNAVPLTLVP
jgi:hypothetical protein